MKAAFLILGFLCYATYSRAAQPIKISWEEARFNLIDPAPVIRAADPGRFAFGAVHVELEIDAGGHVVSAEAVELSRLQIDTSRFAPRALEIVKALRYHPILRNDVPVAARTDEYVRILPLEKIPAKHVAFPKIDDLSSVAFSLKRTECFGSCPIYELHINGDGVVTYSGAGFVAVEGKHSDRIAPSDVQRLLEAFRKTDFFSLDNQYVFNATDGPTFVIGITVGTAAKTVTDYMGEHAGMPLAISALELELDETAGVAKWLAGNSDTVPSLRREGFDFKSNVAGQILAHVAASGDEEAVRALVDAGAPVAITDRVGVTALANAAGTGKSVAVDLLIRHGADVRDPRVLMEAVRSGSPSVVSRILKAGADVKADLPGIRFLLFSAVSWRGGRAKDADRGLVVHLLVNAGADPNVRDANGNVPLHSSLEDEGATRALIDLGANVNAQNKIGETPLMWALSESAVGILLKVGADVALRSQSGKTALDFAQERHLPKVAALLEKAANERK